MRIVQRITIAALLAAIGACAVGQSPRSTSTSPRCAAATFPPDEQIDAWSVDKFAGRYLHGVDALTVRRDDHRLLVDGWTLGTRQLTADNVASWSWRDGCGARYDFVLPPDGPGAWLKIAMPGGGTTDWHR